MKASTVVGAMAGVVLAVGMVWAAQAGRGTNSALDISTMAVGAGGAVGYTPTIGTVQDGIVGDVRATVSADRRYVQLDMHSTVSTVLAIDNFMVVTN